MSPPTFRTARLRLRRQRVADAEAIFAMDSDPRVMRYIREPETDREAFMAGYREWVAGQPAREPWGMWAMERQSDGEVLGWVFLLPLDGDDRGPDADIEIGYRLRFEAWGQGYATEASRKILAHALDDLALERVVAVIHPENAASRNVLRKLGLIRRGLKFAYGADLPYFVIERHEWQEVS